MQVFALGSSRVETSFQSSFFTSASQRNLCPFCCINPLGVVPPLVQLLSSTAQANHYSFFIFRCCVWVVEPTQYFTLTHTEPTFPLVPRTFLSFALYLVCFLSRLWLLTVPIHICYLVCTAPVHWCCSPRTYASAPPTTATLPTI